MSFCWEKKTVFLGGFKDFSLNWYVRLSKFFLRCFSALLAQILIGQWIGLRQLWWMGSIGQFYGPNWALFGLGEFLIWLKRGGKTLKSVKHIKIWYLIVTKTFLGHFWPLLNFYPSKEHFQVNTGPNLDLVWYEILEFAWVSPHLDIIILIWINYILHWNASNLEVQRGLGTYSRNT